MTIIFSEEKDFQTNLILDWFFYFKRTVVRYNGIVNRSSINGFSFQDIDFEYNYNGEASIFFKKNKLIFNSIWFRRPYKGFGDFKTPPIPKKFEKSNIEFNIQLNNLAFKEFAVSLLNEDCKVLGSYYTTSLNKPFTLKKAKEEGLIIPKTIITNNYEKVLNFYLESRYGIICKAIYESFKYVPLNSNTWISNKTELIDKKSKIPKKFAVSLFQENVNKMYELRCFYLNGRLFTTAIFSQNNPKTKNDFRNYDFDKPNRMIPYSLPSLLEKKIINLMNKLKLNCGSIDLIKNTNGDYIFLEINPVGQFGFISNPCNFNLEEKIFKYLTNE